KTPYVGAGLCACPGAGTYLQPEFTERYWVITISVALPNFMKVLIVIATLLVIVAGGVLAGQAPTPAPPAAKKTQIQRPPYNPTPDELGRIRAAAGDLHALIDVARAK